MLILLAVASFSFAWVYASEETLTNAYVAGGAGIGLALFAAVSYAWNMPAAVRDFDAI